MEAGGFFFGEGRISPPVVRFAAPFVFTDAESRKEIPPICVLADLAELMVVDAVFEGFHGSGEKKRSFWGNCVPK